jgi:thiamine-phosphate pyrophosphorylase
MKDRLQRGLYVITDSTLLSSERLVPAVAEAIAGGAVMVQYRDKSGDEGKRLWEAQDLVHLCRPLGIPLIINDDIELALKVEADGVHLGKEDSNLVEARSLLGDDAIIGVSCYNLLANAFEAVDAGADYIAFGRFFPSGTKSQAVQAEPELLLQARAEFDLPIVAIGGITAENGAQLVKAGADLLAVVHGVFGQDDIRAAAERISRLFN